MELVADFSGSSTTGQLPSVNDQDEPFDGIQRSSCKAAAPIVALKTLEGLPDDLLLPILGALGLGELDALSTVSRTLNEKVIDYRLGLDAHT